MAARRRDALWATAAALNGAAGVAAARCAGGHCMQCLACAIPAAGVVLVALLGARRGREPERNPPAAPLGPSG
jgi:hypothetical protein